MRLLLRTSAILLTIGLSGCSLSSLLGGGGGTKAPPTLVTLTPEAAAPAEIARTAAAGQAITVGTPTVAKELTAARVPVQVSPTDIQYVTNVQLVDTPDRLFQGLLEETIRRTTSRVVLDPGQTSLDPGSVLSGQLQQFGYNAATGQVVVTYDAALATAGGNGVQTRRFTASAPADGTASTVPTALNRAANQVALDVAKWIGS